MATIKHINELRTMGPAALESLARTDGACGSLAEKFMVSRLLDEQHGWDGLSNIPADPPQGASDLSEVDTAAIDETVQSLSDDALSMLMEICHVKLDNPGAEVSDEASQQASEIMQSLTDEQRALMASAADGVPYIRESALWEAINRHPESNLFLDTDGDGQ